MSPRLSCHMIMIITRQQGRCRKARSQSTRLRHPPRRRLRQVHAALSTITCRAVQPCSVLTVAAAPSGLSAPPTLACVRLKCTGASLLCNAFAHHCFAMHSHVTAVHHARCHHRGCRSPPPSPSYFRNRRRRRAAAVHVRTPSSRSLFL